MKVISTRCCSLQENGFADVFLLIPQLSGRGMIEALSSLISMSGQLNVGNRKLINLLKANLWMIGIGCFPVRCHRMGYTQYFTRCTQLRAQTQQNVQVSSKALTS